MFGFCVALLAIPAFGARLARHEDFIEVRVLGIVGNSTVLDPETHSDYDMCYSAKINHASNRGIWQVLNAAAELIGRIPGGIGFAITRTLQPLFRYKDAMLNCESQIMHDALQNASFKETAEYNSLLSSCARKSGMAIAGLEGDESIRTVVEVFHILLEHVFHDVELAEHSTQISAEEGAKEIAGVVLAPIVVGLAVKEMVANALLMRTQFAYEEVQAAVECMSAGAHGATDTLLSVLMLIKDIQEITASHLFPELTNVRANTFRLKAALEIVEKQHTATKLSKMEEKLYATTKAQIEEYLNLMTKETSAIIEQLGKLIGNSIRTMNRLRETVNIGFSTSAELQEEKEHKLRQIEIFKNPVTWLRGKIPDAEQAGGTVRSGSARERHQKMLNQYDSDTQDLEVKNSQDLKGNSTHDILVDHITDLNSVLDLFREVLTANKQSQDVIAKYQDEQSLKIARCKAAVNKVMALYVQASGKIKSPCEGEEVEDCTSYPWQKGKKNGGCDKLWYKASENEAYQCQATKFSYACQASGSLGGLLPCTYL